MGSTVGQVVHDSPAAQWISLRDRIVEVNGNPVDVWSDLNGTSRMMYREHSRSVERDNQRVTLDVTENTIPILTENTPLMKKFGLMHQRQRSQIGVDDPASPRARPGCKRAMSSLPSTMWLSRHGTK